ncbi:hypothetical protein KIS1582_2424 [Cytobacillus firmus]|uniref:Uncharacterized protein n=1 Tax=Cytobacillus firmus TaxID=1399 RepID=A0A800MWK3_CYTFI|nr:hypothetical protein KIS1582_2424 [Cytobacillus firmus]
MKTRAKQNIPMHKAENYAYYYYPNIKGTEKYKGGLPWEKGAQNDNGGAIVLTY